MASPTRKSIQAAEQLSRQAIGAFRSRDFDRAAKLFLQAYQIARKPTSIFNAARSKESAGHDAEAKALYELYLRLGESADGVVDARRRVAAIDGREAKRRASAERHMIEVKASTERARLRAEDAIRRAAEARKAKQLAEQQLGALRAEGRAHAASATAVPRDGLVVLPGASSLRGSRYSSLLDRLSSLLAGEAANANIGAVRGHVTLKTQLAAHHGGAAACTLTCRLALARKAKAAFAAGISLYGKPGQLRARVVLWRTVDGNEAGEVELSAVDEAGLLNAAMTALGDVFNGVRRYAVEPARSSTVTTAGSLSGSVGTVAVTIAVAAKGVQVFVDERLVGVAPVQIFATLGPHRLRLVAPGHRRRGGRFIAVVGGGTLRAVLPRLPRQSSENSPSKTTVARGKLAAVVARKPTRASRRPPPRSHDGDRRGRTEMGSAAAVRGGSHDRSTHGNRPSAAQPTARPTASSPAMAPTPRSAQKQHRHHNPLVERTAGQEDVGRQRHHVSLSFPIGLVLSAGGGLSLHDRKAVYADVAGMAETLVHIGVGRGEALPWLILAVGGAVEAYQGLPGTAAGPMMYSGFVGVGVPRAAGLLVGLRKHWVSAVLPAGDFTFTSVEARLVSAQRKLYFAFGARARLSTTRHAMDAFAGGPRFTFFVELGWSIGGHGLSK